MRFLYKKRRNAKISIKRREELIKTVLEDNKSISYAAKKMRIRYSTARFIVHKYATTGLVDPKPALDRLQEPLETPSEDQSSPLGSPSPAEVLPSPREEQPTGQTWVPNPMFMGYFLYDGGLVWSPWNPYCSWPPF